MNKLTIKISLLFFSLIVVVYPLYIRFANSNWDSNASISEILFPFFGLLASSLLWLHAISGVFEPWLRRQFDFDKFVHITSIIILISLLLHPILLLVNLGFDITNLFSFYDSTYIWLGIVAFLLLITYDVGKWLNKYDFFVRNWNKILVVSTVGFLLSFLHSLALGSDLQAGPLRVVWIFYGISAIIATVYTYGVKRFLKTDLI